jgi:hypothetical protein
MQLYNPKKAQSFNGKMSKAKLTKCLKHLHKHHFLDKQKVLGMVLELGIDCHSSWIVLEPKVFPFIPSTYPNCSQLSSTFLLLLHSWLVFLHVQLTFFLTTA